MILCACLPTRGCLLHFQRPSWFIILSPAYSGCQEPRSDSGTSRGRARIQEHEGRLRLRAGNNQVPFKLACGTCGCAGDLSRKASAAKIGRSAGSNAGGGVSRASILSFTSIAFVRSVTNTLHSIALHLENPDLSALPVHLRVLATFSYSAPIKRTSSPT